MSGDRRDAKPPKHKGGSVVGRVSYCPLQVRPSADREDEANGAAALQGNQV